MAKKTDTLVSNILAVLYETAKFLPLPFETPYEWTRRQRGVSKPNYYATLFSMQKRGVVKMVKKQGKKFIQITKKGELEVLLAKAVSLKNPEKSWDGKWRVIIYDIPESSKSKRQLFRNLLKANKFVKLQASVFISPYPLNASALEFLKQTGLIDFIRILRVDAMDDDRRFRKQFGL